MYSSETKENNGFRECSIALELNVKNKVGGVKEDESMDYMDFCWPSISHTSTPAHSPISTGSSVGKNCWSQEPKTNLLQTQGKLSPLSAFLPPSKQFNSDVCDPAAAQKAKTNQQDEIAKSLKIFAMHAAQTPFSVLKPTANDNLDDFATNGYNVDENSSVHLPPNFNAYGQIINPSSTKKLTNNYLNINNRATNEVLNNFYVNNNVMQEISYNNANWMQRHSLSNLTSQTRPGEMEARSSPYYWKVVPIAVPSVLQTKYANHVPKRARSYGKSQKNNTKPCVFCMNNRESEEVAKSHSLRDSQGRILCPKLRIYVCPICQTSGDWAHTVKYCPQKRVVTMEDVQNIPPSLQRGKYLKRQFKI